MSKLNIFSSSQDLQNSNDDFIGRLYSKVSLKKKKGKQLSYINNKYLGNIDKFKTWYDDCKFDKPKNWFPNDQYYYSNFFCDSQQEANDKINQYIKLSCLDNNVDSEIVATLNYLLSETININKNQGLVIFFIEYNLKKNEKFKEYINKWKNQLLDEKEIYQQIFTQVKDKYMVKLYFDICKKEQLLSSDIKLYFNNAFLKHNEYDISLISQLILKNNIYFKYLDKNIPLNSISLEYLFDVTKSYADVYYPQVSVSKYLNNVNLNSTNTLEINQGQFISNSIFSDLSDLNNKNIKDSKLSLDELVVLRDVKSIIDNSIKQFKTFDTFTNKEIKNEKKILETFGKSNLDKITDLDKVLKLESFKNLKYPDWFTKYTKIGLTSQNNIDKYKDDFNKFYTENIKSIFKFNKINDIIENDNNILMPNYLDKMLFQTFFDFNDFTLNELKKTIIEKINNNSYDRDKYIKQNKFNYNQLNISLTNYQLSTLFLESNSYIEGQLLVYIPIIDSEVPLFNIDHILGKSPKDYQGNDTNLDVRKWLDNSGFFKNNQNLSTKILKNNNIGNFLNLTVSHIPAIIILIPINKIINSKHTSIPFVKNINFKNDEDIDIPNKNFNKLEMVNLVKFLNKNKQVISNISFNNPKLNNSFILKYYNYIINELNYLLKSIKKTFSNFSNKLIESKSMEMSFIFKKIFHQYLKLIDKKKKEYENLIKKISSWNDYIYK